MNNLNNVLKSREMFKKYYANKTLEAKEKRDKLEAELEDFDRRINKWTYYIVWAKPTNYWYIKKEGYIVFSTISLLSFKLAHNIA